MRRDRHKFYLAAFSLMAPIAWQGSTPASNSGPELMLRVQEEKDCSAITSAQPWASCPRWERGLPMLQKGWQCTGSNPALFPFLACTGFPPHPSSAAPLLGNLRAG